MAVTRFSDWLVRALQLLPGPLHRSLDAWSRRQAMKRRDRRQHPAKAN